MRYPCTGHVSAEGFGAFLEAELGEPRKNLRAFARELGALFEAPHVTLTASGSAANLAAALTLRERARNLRAIVSAFTFPTTVVALETAGFSVSVVDVEPDGFGIDPAAVDPSVGVVAFTHFLGWPARVRDLPSGPLLLQDACETMHMRIDGIPIHALADATTWSFYHPHHMSSYGGGAVTVRDPSLLPVLESVTHWGRACVHHAGLPCGAPEGPDHEFHYVRRGHNLEMSELNACFGRFSLMRLKSDEALRARHVRTLREALCDVPSLRLWDLPDVGVGPAVFPLTVRSGDARPLVDRLRARGVEARSWMGGVIADQPGYRDLDAELPRARDLSRRSFFIGCHGRLSIEGVAEMAAIVREEAS